jgi:hypothetical protein
LRESSDSSAIDAILLCAKHVPVKPSLRDLNPVR